MPYGIGSVARCSEALGKECWQAEQRQNEKCHAGIWEAL